MIVPLKTLAAVLWTVLILSTSNDAFSGAHTGSLLDLFFLHHLSPPALDALNMLFRKTAHLTGYGILGALWFRALRGERAGWSWRWALAGVAIAALVGGIDEWHQSFVPSRGASPWDVALDTTGALIANVIIRFMVKRTSLVALLLLVCVPLFAETQQVLSQTYTIDKKYRSMEGPGSVITVHLGDPDKPEIVWLTGIKTEVVGEDGQASAPQEMMCHLNVELDSPKHKALFALKRMPSSRLMTLSQGVFEMKLPDGFGFPIASNEPLYLYTQVLNLNIDDPKNLKVRHRVTFTYVRDAALTKPMVALFNAGASGLVQLDDKLAMPPMAMASMTSTTDNSGIEHHSAADCLVGMRAPNAAGMASDYTDPSGRHLTGHWVVPPGRQTNHSDITWFLQLPYDTKIHYATVHLHPFAQSLTLRDTTEDKTLWKATAKNPETGLGLAHADSFESIKGLPLYRDHKYELISAYDNTSGVNQDSMASIFFGLADPEFKKPTRTELAERSAGSANPVGFVVRTSMGDFGATLLRDQAPNTVQQFTRLVYSGALNGGHINAVGTEISMSAPATAEVKPLLLKSIESGAKHGPGTISICPSADDAKSVSIEIELMPAPARDGRCTVFATLGPGAPVIRAIAGATQAIELTKIELIEANAQVPPLAPVKTASAAAASSSK
jgi:VanZ family protein/cyclophilin family peptidyl-prolyl cis-trans isomerase